MPTHREPTTPGEILLEEFLVPIGLTQTELAERMGVHVQVVNAIVRGRRAVTASMALSLAAALGTTPEWWLNMQMVVDLWKAVRERDRVTRRRLEGSRSATGAPTRAKRVTRRRL